MSTNRCRQPLAVICKLFDIDIDIIVSVVIVLVVGLMSLRGKLRLVVSKSRTPGCLP